MSEERIIDKIRKLSAKAESCEALGSEAEARAFSDAVQRLLIQHKLEMSDVEFREEQRKEPVDRHDVVWENHGMRTKKVRIAWIEQLAKWVAKAYCCEIMIYRSSSRIIIVGRKSDREIVEYLLAVLVRSAESIADKEYVRYFYQCRAEGDVTRARGFRAAFLLGFAQRIRERCEELLTQAQSNPLALVRLSGKEAQNFVKNLRDRGLAGRSKSLSRTSNNAAGYSTGRSYADGVDLQGRAAGGGSAPKGISG